MRTLFAFDKKTGGYLGGFSEDNPSIPRKCGLTEIAPESCEQIWNENKQRWEQPAEKDEEKIIRLKNTAISSRKNYLTNTDWYVIREFDQPNSYPIEIKNKRIRARTEINDIQSEEQLERLDSFTNNFS